MKRYFVAVIIALLLAIILVSRFFVWLNSHKTENVITLQLSEVHSDDYPTALADKEFANLVREKTNGRINIEVFTNGRLYDDETKAMDALRDGSVDFIRISSAVVSKIIPELRVIQLPFLFRDESHYHNVIYGKIGREILSSIEKEDVGIVGLCFYDAGARSLYLNKEVHNVEDLNGMKIRIQTSPIMMRLCELVNVNGVIGIPTNEVYNKILNGIVDGAENNIPTFQNMGDYQAASYFIKTEHVRSPDILLLSEKTLEMLSEEDIQIIKECAEKTEAFQKAKWIEKEKEAENIIIKSKNKIVELTESEKKAFVQSVKPLYDEFKGFYPELINRIEEVQ